MATSTSHPEHASWVLRLPNQSALLLISILIVLSQWNPCDTVLGIAKGDSLPLIVLSMAVGFFVAMDAILDRKRRHVTGMRWFLIGLCVLFACWLRLATHNQIQYSNGRYSLNGCWQWIGQIVLLLSLIRLFRSKVIADSLVTLVISCAAGTVAVTLFQHLYTLPKDRLAFARDPSAFLSQLGVVPGSSDALLYASRLSSLEPTGPFALTNSLAGFLLVWIVFLVALTVLVGSRGIETTSVRRSLAWLLGILVILTYAIWLTRSRSAMLAMGFGIASVLWFVPYVRERCFTIFHAYRGVLIGVLCCLIAFFMYAAVREPQLFTGAGKSLAYRLEYWQGAWKIVQTHPWFGVGSCNFQSSYAQVKAITASETPADPHNFLIEVACAGGIPLLILLLIILFAIPFQLFASRVQQKKLKPTQTEDRDEIQSMNDSKLVAIGASTACSGLLAFYYLTNDLETLFASFLFFGFGGLSWFGIRQSKLSFCTEELKYVCFLSAGALLLHLSFSGGWMTPGLMLSFSVLVSLGIRVNGELAIHAETWPMSQPRRVVSWSRRFSLPILLLIATLDLSRTVCIPVIAASNEFASDPSLASSRSAEEWLETMQLDHWDPELPRRVASQCVQVLTKRNLSGIEHAKWLAAFNVASEEFLRRDRNHWSAAAECGRWNAFLGEKDDSNQDDIREKNRILEHRRLAFSNFNQAAEWYPHSVYCQLQAAVAAAWVGESKSVEDRIQAALKIDRTTTHLDRKIEASVVIFPNSLENQGAKLPIAAREDLEPMAARGEPVLDWLRIRVK